jgi:hypothetical protein
MAKTNFLFGKTKDKYRHGLIIRGNIRARICARAYPRFGDRMTRGVSGAEPKVVEVRVLVVGVTAFCLLAV